MSEEIFYFLAKQISKDTENKASFRTTRKMSNGCFAGKCWINNPRIVIRVYCGDWRRRGGSNQWVGRDTTEPVATGGHYFFIPLKFYCAQKNLFQTFHKNKNFPPENLLPPNLKTWLRAWTQLKCNYVNRLNYTIMIHSRWALVLPWSMEHIQTFLADYVVRYVTKVTLLRF